MENKTGKTSFEIWAEGLIDDDTDIMIHEREYYATLSKTPEEKKARWAGIDYQPPKRKTGQLKLF